MALFNAFDPLTNVFNGSTTTTTTPWAEQGQPWGDETNRCSVLIARAFEGTITSNEYANLVSTLGPNYGLNLDCAIDHATWSFNGNFHLAVEVWTDDLEYGIPSQLELTNENNKQGVIVLGGRWKPDGGQWKPGWNTARVPLTDRDIDSGNTTDWLNLIHFDLYRMGGKDVPAASEGKRVLFRNFWFLQSIFDNNTTTSIDPTVEKDKVVGQPQEEDSGETTNNPCRDQNTQEILSTNCNVSSAENSTVNDTTNNSNENQASSKKRTAGIAAAIVLAVVGIVVGVVLCKKWRQSTKQATMNKQLKGAKTTAYNNPQFDAGPNSRCQQCGTKTTQCICRQRAESIAQGNIPKMATAAAGDPGASAGAGAPPTAATRAGGGGASIYAPPAGLPPAHESPAYYSSVAAAPGTQAEYAAPNEPGGSAVYSGVEAGDEAVGYASLTKGASAVYAGAGTGGGGGGGGGSAAVVHDVYDMPTAGAANANPTVVYAQYSRAAGVHDAYDMPTADAANANPTVVYAQYSSAAVVHDAYDMPTADAANANPTVVYAQYSSAAGAPITNASGMYAPSGAVGLDNDGALYTNDAYGNVPGSSTTNA